jgi:hypothetical protein
LLNIMPLRAPHRSWLRRLGGRAGEFMLAFDLALQVRRERRLLVRLDERTLKDVGLNACDVDAETLRAFWDVPEDRIRF